jgi:hypothetical protein
LIRKKFRKGQRKMTKKAFAIVAILFLALGFTALASAEVQEGTGGKEVPVITQSFASKEVRPGDNWNVYLNVSDPDGNIKSIFAVVYRLGGGEYPVGITRVRKENNKELSGYIYMYTSGPGFSGQFVKLTLTIYVQDRSGNFSQPAVFPLFIHQLATLETPPQGLFKEQAIGPIMVQLQNIPGGVSGSGMPK